MQNTTFEKVIIHTDGGSRGNPGPSACGYTIQDSQGRIIDSGGEYIGITTNNIAEYQAVKIALEKALSYGFKNIEFYLDSLLVVNQMINIFKIKNRELWPIHEDIKRLLGNFGKVTFTHIPRERNKLADSEVNKILDSYEKR